jgi:hypothetical protein
MRGRRFVPSAGMRPCRMRVPLRRHASFGDVLLKREMWSAQQILTTPATAHGIRDDLMAGAKLCEFPASRYQLQARSGPASAHRYRCLHAAAVEHAFELNLRYVCDQLQTACTARWRQCQATTGDVRSAASCQVSSARRFRRVFGVNTGTWLPPTTYNRTGRRTPLTGIRPGQGPFPHLVAGLGPS